MMKYINLNWPEGARKMGVVILLFSFTASHASNIIPRPLFEQAAAGIFTLSENTAIVSGNHEKEEAGYLRKILENDYHLRLSDKTKAKINYIRLSLDPGLHGEMGDEGYQLQVDPAAIVISAASTAGIFYGIQSFRQLLGLTATLKPEYPIEAVLIKDRPRFSWRAFMLDEGRHFHGAAVVRQIIDEMALLKMNTFHWHLTEDQGWRIEIKKYPLLTAIGGKRDSSMTGGWGTDKPVFDKKPHEGFYTQEEIRTIILYAKQRHITIIPEIDMPGHSSAAIAAYPWLSASGKKISVPGYWGVLDYAYNVADPKVIRFLKDVMDEVIGLFPSPVIHIGGDEVKYDEWKSSPMVTDFMKEKGLRSPAPNMVYKLYVAIFTDKGKKDDGMERCIGRKDPGSFQQRAG